MLTGFRAGRRSLLDSCRSCGTWGSVWYRGSGSAGGGACRLGVQAEEYGRARRCRPGAGQAPSQAGSGDHWVRPPPLLRIYRFKRAVPAPSTLRLAENARSVGFQDFCVVGMALTLRGDNPWDSRAPPAPPTCRRVPAWLLPCPRANPFGVEAYTGAGLIWVALQQGLGA